MTARHLDLARVLTVRIGKTDVRPLGGAPGCLAMIAFSILASVILTIVLNVILR